MNADLIQAKASSSHPSFHAATPNEGCPFDLTITGEVYKKRTTKNREQRKEE
jgi:hypothetical protein